MYFLKLVKIQKYNIRNTKKLLLAKKQVSQKDVNIEQDRLLIDENDTDIQVEKPKFSYTQEQIQEREEQRKQLYLKHDLSLERRLHQHTVDHYYEQFDKSNYNLAENPLSTLELLDQAIIDTLPQTEEYLKTRDDNWKEYLNTLNIQDFEGKNWSQIKKYQGIMNPDRIINEKYNVSKRENVPKTSLRCGAIGQKIGMTAVYDQWGTYQPLTVIQLDRNQVIGHRTMERDGYDALIVGSGQKSFNRLDNATIGQFLKVNTPPKRYVKEFKIDPQNTLPIGYMISVRHFTVGQYVDVVGKTKGKGFMGVMKAWNFKGQSATHGTEQVQRHGGAIGNHQDPGRVWKKKKMPGRHGFKVRQIKKLQVYKIDYPRSLIYLKGSVMGSGIREVYLRDSFMHQTDNIGRINYPTFIYEEGKVYPDQIQVFPGELDPNEQFLHENQIAKQYNEEDEALAGDEEGEAPDNQ